MRFVLVDMFHGDLQEGNPERGFAESSTVKPAHKQRSEVEACLTSGE